MWPRLSEILLGIWLVGGPIILGWSTGQPGWMALDVTTGLLAILLATVSLVTQWHKSHLGSLGVALALILCGYFGTPHGHPALQNEILTGLILMMLAVVPGEASLPPRSWREPGTR